jgi:heme-degrading monooxygenase HmoA
MSADLTSSCRRWHIEAAAYTIMLDAVSWADGRFQAGREGGSMFIRIRKYTVRHGVSEELTRRVGEGYLPLLRQMPGFKGYYLLDGGPDVLVSISVFDSAETALASGEKTAAWVRNNALELVCTRAHGRQRPNR